MRLLLGSLLLVSAFAYDFDPKNKGDLLYELKKEVITKISKGLTPMEPYTNRLTGTCSRLIYGDQCPK